MSLEIPESVASDSYQKVTEAMAQLGAECTQFQQFVVDMFDQFETMAVKLSERDGRVAAERQRISEQQAALDQMRDDRQEQDETRDELQRRLVDLQTELDETKATLEAQCARAQQNERENEEFRELVESLERDLESSKEERGRLQHEGDVAEPADAGRLAELEEERAALEAELEQARHRAAELANSMAQQKKQLVDERSSWADELSQLRSLVSARSGSSPNVRSAPLTDAGQSSGGKGFETTDPVVGSVLAQFAQLQKDAASRKSKEGG